MTTRCSHSASWWRSHSGAYDADPATSVQALDRIHDGLRDLAHRRLHDGRYTDQEGQLRLIVRTLQWDGYVRLAFDEIREAGAGTPKIDRRLRAALLNLA